MVLEKTVGPDRDRSEPALKLERVFERELT
jgi:hypothetical protein